MAILFKLILQNSQCYVIVNGIFSAEVVKSFLIQP